MSYVDELERADRAMLAAFGEVVIYAPTVSSPVPVTGIFDLQYVLAKGSAEAGAETLGPAVFFFLADLPTDPRDDEDDELRLTIQGVVYRVIERRPDGMGRIVLAVRRVT